MEDAMPVPELGPFQDMWEAWEEARGELLEKPIYHFRRATDIQFDELEEHLKSDDPDAAAREATDIISIALNLMRRLGYTPAEISKIAQSRAAQRMKGQTLEILDKYQHVYGI